MFDFTLEWTNLQPPAARAINAKTAIDHIGVRESWIAPLILLTTFLFALGIITTAHLRQPDDQTLRRAAVAGMSVSMGMGMPMLYPSQDVCRRSGPGSAFRLRHADVHALLGAE